MWSSPVNCVLPHEVEEAGDEFGLKWEEVRKKVDSREGVLGLRERW